MRRIALPLIACTLAVTLIGCKSNGTKGMNGSPLVNDYPSDSFYLPDTNTSSRESAYTPEPVHREIPRVVERTLPIEPVIVEKKPSTAMLQGTRTPGKRHTVAKRDTLYSLARAYYGDASRWKDIYQANQNIIKDPNRILVGQQLRIP